MTYRPSVAEAQAIGLCHLARGPGLPQIAVLRFAVAQLHPLACGWCAYPREDLLAMLAAYHPMVRDESAWRALPHKARRAALAMAQGHDAA